MADVRHRGLRRYLLPDENPAAEIRHHAIVLLKPASIFVLATALALWLDLSVSQANSGMLTYVWLLWLAVGLWAAWRWIEWSNTRVVATDKRIVLFEGWINHKVSMMPLKKVTDMGYQRSVLGRILGYGTFVLESAGQDQALSKISFVPNPDENYRAICAVVFGLATPDLDDDDPIAWDEPVPDPRDHLTPNSTFLAPDEDWERQGASIYRSRDRWRRDHDADTGELPPYDPDDFR